MDSFKHLRLSLFLLFGCIAVYIGFVGSSGADAIWGITYLGYWMILIPFVLWCLHLYCDLKERYSEVWTKRSRIEWLRLRRWGPVAYILACSIITLCSQPGGFKIVMDELVLLASSMQMHYSKQALAGFRGYEIEGVFHLIGGAVDKRPLFFPFLLSLLHDLTGFRTYQGLYLNAFLTPVFFGLNFILGQKLWRPYGGYLAVALWMTVPLIAINARGCGFDLLNLVMLLTVLLAAGKYLQTLQNRDLNRLLLSMVLLALTRYESVLFVLAVGIVILIGWWRQRSIQITWTMVFVPLLLLPAPVQQKMFADSDRYWQMRSGYTTAFSLDYLADNFLHAGNYFFSLDPEQANSLLLSILAVLASGLLVLWGLKHFRKLGSGEGFDLALIGFGLIVIVNFLVLMAYHWGQLDDVMATRLGLPFILMQVVFVIYAMRCLAETWPRLPLYASILIGFFFVGVTRPAFAYSDFYRWEFTRQHIEELIRFTQSHEEPALFISDRHLASIITERSALTTEDALDALPKLDFHIRMHTFSDVYLAMLLPTKMAQVENHSLLRFEVALRERVEEAFDLERIKDVKLNDAVYVRFSRVKGVHLDPDQRLEIDPGNVSVGYTGRLEIENENALKKFVEFMPR